jgi:hypothetical protein
MNEGIQILIERVKTNPEDFSYNSLIDSRSKWSNLLNNALASDDFTSEEKDALKEAVRQKNRDSFTSRVMRALLVEDEPSDEGKSMGRHPIQGTGLGGQTLASSLAISNGGTGNATWGTSSISLIQALENAHMSTDKTMLEHLKEKIFK